MSNLCALRTPGIRIPSGMPKRARHLIPRKHVPIVAAHVTNEKMPLEAVVIGGGIAGLLTAHVLSEKFDRVVMVEKDNVESGRVEDETFKETAVRRRGVAQFTQPHQLIFGAVKALDSLMPGFRTETVAKGGIDLDLGLHVHYYDYGKVFPKSPSGLKGLGVSRRFLEQCIRDRVFKEDRDISQVLEVRQGVRVKDFLWKDDCVEGVVLDDGSEIRSHIVIDTTGRGSKTPEWLQRRGLQAPDMISVDPKVASSSRMVKMPRNWDQEWKLLLCKTQPYGKCGGTLLPCEGDMWQVTLAEFNGRNVPRDEDGFLEYAKNLPDRTMYEALLRSTPVTEIKNYSALRNELLCYHTIEIPRGLLLVGDSVQRLNAIYGQGIGAASQSVVLFKDALHKALMGCVGSAERREAVAVLGRSFQPRLAASLNAAWTLATKADLKYDTTTASGAVAIPSPLDNFITDSLLTAAQTDPRVYHKVLSVAYLTAPTSSLVTDPYVLAATAKSAIGLWRTDRTEKKSEPQVA